MKSHLQSPKNVAPSLPWHLHIPSSFVCSSQWISLCKHGASILQKISNAVVLEIMGHINYLLSQLLTHQNSSINHITKSFFAKKQANDQNFHPNFFKQSTKNSSPQPKHHTHTNSRSKNRFLTKTIEKTANPVATTHNTHTHSHHQPG